MADNDLSNAMQGFAQNFANLASNIVGAQDSKKARQHSWNMFKDEQAWQEKMYNQQVQDNLAQWNRTNEWNLAQWNRENKYNSPAEQVKRYLEAGINPALAMTGGADSGQAGSVSSQQSSPGSFSGVGVPSTTPFMPDMSGVNAAFGNATAMELNSSVAAKNAAETQRTLASIPGIHLDNEGKQLNNAFLGQTLSNRVQNSQLQNDLLVGQKVMQNLDSETKAIMNQYLPAQLQSEIAVNQASRSKMAMEAWRLGQITPLEMAEIKSRERLNVAHAIKTNAETQGINIENSVAERIADAVVKNAYQQNVLNWQEIQLRRPSVAESNDLYDYYYKGDSKNFIQKIDRFGNKWTRRLSHYGNGIAGDILNFGAQFVPKFSFNKFSK